MPPSGDRATIESWKEIASYLSVTVRSAQRWEVTAGLPVHRHGTGPSARAYAFKDELDGWLADGPLRAADRVTAAPPLRRRYTPAWIAICVVLAGVLAGWSTGALPSRGVPQTWTADGQKLTILDSRERVCWTRSFPQFHVRFTPEFHDLVRIGDIDGDGEPEVLFNHNARQADDAKGTLFCFDANGKLRWQFAYGARKSFAGREFEPHYWGHIVTPLQIAGKRYVLTVANHHLWYPAQVALLDAASGNKVEEYWHPGAIYFSAIQDLNADGQDEFLFAAINNPGQGLGHAALGVLALPFSAARAASGTPEPWMRPLTGGGELAYVMFPTSDLNRAAAQLPRPVAMRVEQNRRILFQTPAPEDGGIVYTLDFRLQVLEHRFSDNFPLLHDRMHAQGLIGHRISAQESTMLGKVVRFPGAPDGNRPELESLWRMR